VHNHLQLKSFSIVDGVGSSFRIGFSNWFVLGPFPYPVFANLSFFLAACPTHSFRPRKSMCVCVCLTNIVFIFWLLDSMPLFLFFASFWFVFSAFSFCFFLVFPLHVDISFDSQLSSFVLSVDTECECVCVRVLNIVICTRVCPHTNANCLPVISGHLSCPSSPFHAPPVTPFPTMSFFSPPTGTF